MGKIQVSLSRFSKIVEGTRYKIIYCYSNNKDNIVSLFIDEPRFVITVPVNIKIKIDTDKYPITKVYSENTVNAPTDYLNVLAKKIPTQLVSITSKNMILVDASSILNVYSFSNIIPLKKEYNVKISQNLDPDEELFNELLKHRKRRKRRDIEENIKSIAENPIPLEQDSPLADISCDDELVDNPGSAERIDEIEQENQPQKEIIPVPNERIKIKFKEENEILNELSPEHVSDIQLDYGIMLPGIDFLEFYIFVKKRAGSVEKRVTDAIKIIDKFQTDILEDKSTKSIEICKNLMNKLNNFSIQIKRELQVLHDESISLQDMLANPKLAHKRDEITNMLSDLRLDSLELINRSMSTFERINEGLGILSETSFDIDK